MFCFRVWFNDFKIKIFVFFFIINLLCFLLKGIEVFFGLVVFVKVVKEVNFEILIFVIGVFVLLVIMILE